MNKRIEFLMYDIEEYVTSAWSSFKYKTSRILASFFFKMFQLTSGCLKSANYRWAENEFFIHGGYQDDSGNLDSIASDALKLLSVVCFIGDTTYSVSATVNVLKELSALRPLSPLTGEDSEWTCSKSEPDVYYNNRYPSISKRPDIMEGKPVRASAVIFREPSGAMYTSKNSMRQITFPYTVTSPAVIDVPAAAGDRNVG